MNKPTNGESPEADDFDLRPPGLIRYGLARAIQVHSEQVRARHPRLLLTLDLVDDEQLLADDAVRTLYGVYVESVHNALRHAHASRIAVRYHPTGSDMELEIEDNGQGFLVPQDWLAFTRQNRFGLARLRQQVAVLGGKFCVTSEPGEGTVVSAKVPLSEGTHNPPADQ